MFSRPKILFLVSLLFVALLNSIPTYLLNFQFFYQSSSISDINTAMDNGLTTCINGQVQTTRPVWNSALPSFDAPAFCANFFNVSPIHMIILCNVVFVVDV